MAPVILGRNRWRRAFTQLSSLVVIANRTEHTAFTAWAVPGTHLLPMPQHILVEGDQHHRVIRKLLKQNPMGGFGAGFRANQPYPLADAMHMRIDRHHRL